MFHAVLVFVHAGAGVGGLLFGLGALSPPRPGDGRSWPRRVYSLCVAVLLSSLAALVVADWTDLDAGSRVAFAGLGALGAVMAYRLALARRQARARGAGWAGRYVGHVYFTYISLWVGFLVLPALNLPMPQVCAPLVVVAALLVGRSLVGRYKRRVLAA